MSKEITELLTNIKNEYNQKNYELFIEKLKDENLNPEFVIQLKNEIFELAKKIYEKNEFIFSLNILIYCHKKCKCENIKNFILEHYYQPFIEKYKKTYQKNIEILKNYKYIQKNEFTDFEELNLFFIPYQMEINIPTTTFAVYDKSKNEFTPIHIVKLLLPPGANLNLIGKIILLNDIYDTDFIFDISDKTEDIDTLTKVFNKKTQIYLHYESFFSFTNHLQLFDWEKCLNIHNLVFTFGRNEIQNFFINNTLKLPELYISSPNPEEKNINELFNLIHSQRKLLFSQLTNQIFKYYSKLKISDIINKIKQKKVKIAVISSRFTSALQYYSRDCFEALKNIGIEVKFFLEESILTTDYDYMYFKIFNEFQPDIAITCDYHRTSITTPPTAIHVCWLIDFLPHLFSKAEISKLGLLDFTLNLCFSDQNLSNIGYNPDQMIDAPISINLNLYKKYALSEKEIEDYACDVCIISNTGDINFALESFCKCFNITYLIDEIKKIADKIYNDMYNEVELYFDLELIKKILNKVFINKGMIIKADILQQVAYNFKSDVIAAIYKNISIIWLHEKGYNINLWGRAWINHPILKKYSKGIAKNGETMSKILNASKISVGLNKEITLHPRALEALMSNSFYIGNAIPEKYDHGNIKKYLKEDEEVVLFYNREDLYKKIDYYLKNESERKRIMKNAQRVIREKLTFEVIMNNMLNKIQQRLSLIN